VGWVASITCAVPAPPNNNCSAATPIPVTLDGTCSNQLTGTNVGATASGATPAPSCASFGGGQDVWYSVTVPATGSVTIEMKDASGPTNWAMQVYSGSCGSLTAVECDDDDGDGLFSLVALTNRTPGEVLLVRVFEYGNDATGAFKICAHAPACGATNVYLETATGSYLLDEPCDPGNGWTYYSKPGAAGNYMFAIEWFAANATAKANAAVEVTVGSMISAQAGSTSASYGMGRYWNVNTTSLTSAANIRFFYSPAEKAAVEAAATSFANNNSVPNNGFSWFKTNGTSFTPLPFTPAQPFHLYTFFKSPPPHPLSPSLRGHRRGLLWSSP
jgi:hypothetical protein